MMRACGPELAMDRAHQETCASCRQEWRALAERLAKVRALRVEMPDPARREEVRTSVIAAAGLRRGVRVPVRTWPRAAAIAAAAAAAVVASTFASSHGGEVRWASTASAVAMPHATITRSPGTQLEVTSGPPDEIVRLHEGTVHLEVTPLAGGERMRVVVGGDEVEVRGTAFDVSAETDRLVAVHVVHGRVEVRVEGRDAVVLGAGEAWARDDGTGTSASVRTPFTFASTTARPLAPATTHASTSASSSASARTRSAPKAASTIHSHPVATESDYEAGWRLLRTDDFAGAATAFARVDKADPLADDAGYWHAVALARVPRAADAIVAFRAFLGDHPGSVHGGEAAAMLGWLLVDAGELDEARARFREAIRDPDPRVAKSARAGLAAVQ